MFGPPGVQSNSQSRGIKVYGGQPVKAGGIIFRQVGSTWHEGTNTGLGKDYTLFSLVDGIVIYDKKKVRPAVSPSREPWGGGWVTSSRARCGGGKRAWYG